MKSRLLVVSTLVLASVPSYAGGIIGGGGNILPEDRVTTNEILDVIYGQVRYNAWTYLNHLAIPGGQNISDPTRIELRSKILKLPNVIKEISFILPAVDPCHDPFTGLETDASASEISPGRFELCFSLSRIQHKLSKVSLTPQLIALGVHEISHLLGFDEDSAVHLQQLAIGDLVGQSAAFPSQLMASTFNALSSVSNHLSRVQQSGVLSELDLYRIQNALPSVPCLSLPFRPFSQWAPEGVELFESLKLAVERLRPFSQASPYDLARISNLQNYTQALQAQLLY